MPNQIRALSAPASGWNHDVSGGLGTPEPATGVPSPAAGPSVHPRSLAATGRQLTRDEDHRVEARFSNGEWYPATVVSINDDGSLEVLFDDGIHLSRVGAEHVLDPTVQPNTPPPEPTPDAPQPASHNPLEEAPIGKQKATAVDPRSLARTGGVVAPEARVEALFANGEWYPATVTAVHGDGTYAVLFDDGVAEPNLGPEAIRDPAAPEPPPVQPDPPLREPSEPPAPSSPPNPLEEAPLGGKKPASSPEAVDPRCLAATGVAGHAGMAVEALFANGEWYPASITAAHADGSYGVLFEDGYEEAAMGPESIRDPNARPAPPPASPPPAAESTGATEVPICPPVATNDEVPIGQGQGVAMEEFPPDEDPNEEMAECEECGRRMRASVLEKHMNIHKTRKKFNSKARMVDKEARQEKRSALKAGESAAKAPKPKSKGAEQSRQLREAMKAVREAKREEMMKAKANGGSGGGGGFDMCL